MIISGASQAEINRAAEVVRAGGIIAYPTETYYGLGVDPFNAKALARLFEVKRRPGLKPVLVLIADQAQLDLLADHIPDPARQLMEGFWPGPLTIVFPARSSLPAPLTGGTGTIGVRLSPHPLAQKLLDAYGRPMTATSANISGYSAAVSAEEVSAAFAQSLDLIVDGGIVPGVQGSTLVGFQKGSMQCIREGRISCTVLRQYLQSRTENT